MEKKKIELPLIDPMYSTYHYQGAATAILSENPSIRNWYLNNAIQLTCNLAFIGNFTTPEVSVKKSSFLDNPNIEVIRIPMRCLGEYVHGVIKTLLDEGYYIYYTGIDDFYVEGKSWYQERHFSHDGLICGYDQDKRTYSIYAYDKNWVYRCFETSQDSFEEGRRIQFEQGMYGMLNALHVKSDYVELNIKTIYNEILEYLESSWEKYPPYRGESVYGCIVHDYIVVYLYKLIIGAFPYERMDFRIFRVLWEHKKVMLERITAVEQELAVSDNISSRYKQIVKDADNMRMIYASHHRRRRDSVLHLLRNNVLELKEKEGIILRDFLSIIKEHI